LIRLIGTRPPETSCFVEVAVVIDTISMSACVQRVGAAADGPSAAVPWPHDLAVRVLLAGRRVSATAV
jgi:hypothetical protein